MNVALVEKVYVRECQAHARKMTEGELDAWRDVLSGYSESDVDRALRRWRANTTIEEFTQRPCGSRMPTPAELKLSIARFDSEKRSAASGQFVACGQNGCDDGWLHRLTGVTVGVQMKPGDRGVSRCECWMLYLCACFNCDRAQLAAVLAERARDRAKARGR